jgi:hypothetical protein
MDELERAYTLKRAKYDALIAENNPSKVPDIQALNAELSTILHGMLQEVTKVKGDAGKLDIYRDELVKKLVKVQNDYSIMLKQKDQYDTLKLLQNHEQTKFNAVLFWYILALGIVTFLFIIVLMWKGGYKAPTMPTMMSSPMTSPPFM